MSLLSSSIGNIRCLADEEADHNMLQDLQLAAELGKTLLERNKELENIIKAHQSTVEEQAQEIEYMKKQTAALREVNDSRLKIYEQLEVSIQDLERANHRLVIENTSDKKLIKSQCLTIENLEARCEELQKKIDEINVQHESLLRQQSTNTAQTQTALWKASVTQSGSIQQSAALPTPKAFQDAIIEPNTIRQITSAQTNDDEVTELLRKLQEVRCQRAWEQNKVSELEQQLANVLQENSALEEQLNDLRSKAQDVKNLQQEINTLEDVRRGIICGRCLRGMDNRTHDELSIMLNQEEYDDISIAESLMSDTQRDTESLIQDPNNKGEVSDEHNPYRVLVEKYHALLEVQRSSRSTVQRQKDVLPKACMSLQEELEMSGDFNNFQNPTTETEVQQESTKSMNGNGGRGKNEICGKKTLSATPTDFSEAETSSSGFSDETSNKATQTEGRPGSFLCSIADGEDCKFSIYDDNSPFESRFRKTPEYRQLFSEIFSVLKRAAEAKDEGEKLPLLDDSTSATASQAQSSPVLPPEDPASEMTDDNQSVISSVLSSTMSEPLYSRVQTPVPAKGTTEQQNNSSTRAQPEDGKNTTGQRNGCRLEYLSINVTKKSAKKHASRKLAYNDRPATPDVIPTTNPKVIPPKSNSSGKKKFRPFTITNHDDTYSYSNRTKESSNNRRRSNNTYTNGTDQHNNSFEYREYKPSTASEEVARLKRLEMSYAEVLRLSSKSKVCNHHRN